MRRSPMGPRKAPMPGAKKPMVRSAPLRRAALNRQGERTRDAAANAVQKPPSRPSVSPEERRARATVKERSGLTCEVCGRAPMANWHHRRNKGQGGAWCPSNGLAVCGTGTTGCHGLITVNPALARERGWSVSAYADPAKTPVWLAGRGWHYLLPDGSVRPADERKAA